MACGVCRLVRAGVAAVTVMLLLAGSGVAASARVPVEVAPTVGGPRTAFLLSFTAPVRTGVIGSIRLRDLLTATNASAGTGCLAQINAPVPDARRGQRVHVRLDPKTLGGNWCIGAYRGSVRELQTAVCPHGTACPTYVRLVATVARFSLIVRSTGATGNDVTPPIFAGIAHAFACTPGPQRPGQTTPYTLSWQAASDNRTPPPPRSSTTSTTPTHQAAKTSRSPPGQPRRGRPASTHPASPPTATPTSSSAPATPSETKKATPTNRKASTPATDPFQGLEAQWSPATPPARSRSIRTASREQDAIAQRHTSG